MIKKIRKAVFPVGGMGTRFLPATKSMPKEMLPVVDKPLIQYVVEEAIAAGIEELIFVTGRGKTVIEDHFDRSFELEDILKTRGIKVDHVTLGLPKLLPGNITYTRQQEPLGLGHAVWCARHLIKDEPFAVLLADDFIHSKTPCLKQMIDIYNESGKSMVAIMDVSSDQIHRYGIIEGKQQDKLLVRIDNMIEKPQSHQTSSTLAIIGRYLLDDKIFSYLERHIKGAGGEIQLTDALSHFISKHALYGFYFEGKRFDCGSKVGLLMASLTVALKREDLSKEIYQELEILWQNNIKSI